MSNLLSRRMTSMPVLRNGWAALYALPDLSDRLVCSPGGRATFFGFVF